MELQQLRYFTAVTRFRNFTKAAEFCNVAQPSLSIQIKKLEDELGTPLFHRQGRNIQLTEAGESLLHKAEGILSLHKNALGEIHEQVSRGGTARFGAILTIAPYLIPSLICADRTIELPAYYFEENFTDILLDQIRNGELDFGLMSTPIGDPNLMVKVVAEEPFMLVHSVNHRFEKKKKIQTTDIFSESLLSLSNLHCAGKQVSDMCQLNQQIPRSEFASSQIETILRLVSMEKGIALLPKMSLFNASVEGIHIRDLPKDMSLTRQISIVQHPDRFLNKSTLEWMKIIETTLKSYEQSL